MRLYEVQPGDSPATIAIKYAGCPKCAKDLVLANTHKRTVVYPNGFLTFASMTPGEQLYLPEKWFNGELDDRPPAYFAALPYHDGVSPSSLGDLASAVLGDFETLDMATILAGTLATLDDSAFNQTVPEAATVIDSAVSGADNSNPAAAARARDVHTAVAAARARNNDLSAAIAAGDHAAATSARLDIQNSFSSALSNVRLALQAQYSSPPSTTAFPAVLVDAAKAAAAAINADPSYCAAVAQTGSAVNAAVHAFKVAWNASGNVPQVPSGTGNYEQTTAEVLAEVLGGAPLPCDAHAATPAPKPPTAGPPPASPPLIATNAPTKKPLSTGAVAAISLLAAGAVGGTVYLVKQGKLRL